MKRCQRQFDDRLLVHLEALRRKSSPVLRVLLGNAELPLRIVRCLGAPPSPAALSVCYWRVVKQPTGTPALPGYEEEKLNQAIRDNLVKVKL